MTTSTLNIPQQQTDGRTVRDIVEYNQELVSESWCRRIIRQLLQSLEVQYGMHMPHRPITPDSVQVLDSGDPLLLAGVVAPLDPPPDNLEARDLHDLAALIHYAITLDLAPTAPLSGRALPDYSDSFLAAIDTCLFAAPDARPQTIARLRDLLGIVVLGPPSAGALPPELHEMPVPARRSSAEPHAPDVRASAPRSPAPPMPAPPMPEPRMAAPRRSAEPPSPLAAVGPQAGPADIPARLKRWLMIGGAALVLLATLAALFSLLRQTDASDALALALPVQQESAAQLAQDAGARSTLVTVPVTPPAQPDGPVIDARAADSALAASAAAPSDTHPTPWPEPAPEGAAPPTAVRLAPQGTPPGAAIAGTTYRLAIKPWASIVVDGVERGVSPPLRHITLPPGEHTIAIVNPGFAEHTVTVQSTEGASGTIELDFTEEETP